MSYPFLQDLLAPLTPEHFLSAYWEKQALHLTSSDTARYRDLFTEADLTAALRFSPCDWPEAFSMSFHGKPVIADDYRMPDGSLHFDQVQRFHQAGATIILNSIQRYSHKVLCFVQDLEKDLGYSVNANLYVTPKNSQGFSAHYDDHDVFVTQMRGSKQWKFYGPYDYLPDEDIGSRPQPDISGGPQTELTMKTGDLLYVPRGEVHAAVAVRDERSAHITFGISPLNWRSYLRKIVDAAYDKHMLMRHLVPVGFLSNPADHEQIRIQASHMLAEIDRVITASDVLARYRRSYPWTQEEYYPAQRLGSAMLEEVRPDTLFTFSPDHTLEEEQDRVGIRSDHTYYPLELKKEYIPAIRWVSKAPAFTASDVPSDHPLHIKQLLTYYLLNNGVIVKA